MYSVTWIGIESAIDVLARMYDTSGNFCILVGNVRERIFMLQLFLGVHISRVPDVTVWYDEYDGAYDVRAYKIFEDTTLSSMIGSVFDCELAIPTTNYINRRTTVFEPG